MFSRINVVVFRRHDQKQGKSEGFDSCDRPSNLTQIGLKWSIFHPCDLEIWFMTQKYNKALLLYLIKLCVSFQANQWIQTEVTVRKRPIWVKFDDFLSRVTLQFNVWPWQTIGHLFYATSSFVHYFVAIGDFKLELQSGNAQFGSKSTIFRTVRPCNLTYDLVKNNRAPLLCYFKLCASFRSHWWIQTGVTVRKHPIWVKFRNFSAVWPWNLTDDLEKQ